jgi:hypothetical protein
MNKNWTLVRVLLNQAGYIDMIEYRIEFTDDRYPGVSSLHAGIRNIPPLLTADADDAIILDTLQRNLTPDLSNLEVYHQTDLEWQYKLKTATVIQKEELPITYLDLKPIDFELGMLRLNITFEQIDAKIEEMQDPDRLIARIYWRRATRFERSNPLVDQIGSFFGKTPAEIDGVWLQQQSTITDQVAYMAA